jgi:glycerol-3-phosphate dehydrogenase (NAD(P)+)
LPDIASLKIAVLGAGNWGTTMALLLHRTGHQVALWEFDRAQADFVSRTRENAKFLPGQRIPDPIRVTSVLNEAMEGVQIALLAVPTQVSRSVLSAIGGLPSGGIIVSLMKGIERETLDRVSMICLQEIEGFDLSRFAVISGPTIAPEVASGLPTSAVVASSSAETARFIQKHFSSAGLRLYTSDDVIGVELAGALKNVIALAAGICDGLQLGYNIKGALLTRGLREISRLGTMLGGNRQTFSGLSGLGDLVTTCTSPSSRNHYVGEHIGRGEAVADVLKNMVMVAEGVWTARAAKELAARHGVEMPITEAVCRVLDDGKDPRTVLGELMLRNLKAED